jgi:hypothetical protein
MLINPNRRPSMKTPSCRPMLCVYFIVTQAVRSFYRFIFLLQSSSLFFQIEKYGTIFSLQPESVQKTIRFVTRGYLSSK